MVVSSAVAVISVPGGALTDYARGGSAAEAVWITAHQRGLAVPPISPVFLYARDVEVLTELSTAFADELGDLQKEFQQLVQIPATASPALVLLLPDSFIGIAESMDLAGELGRFVLRNACAEFSRWRSRGRGTDRGIALNVSPLQLATRLRCGAIAISTVSGLFSADTRLP